MQSITTIALMAYCVFPEASLEGISQKTFSVAELRTLLVGGGCGCGGGLVAPERHTKQPSGW